MFRRLGQRAASGTYMYARYAVPTGTVVGAVGGSIYLSTEEYVKPEQRCGEVEHVLTMLGNGVLGAFLGGVAGFVGSSVAPVAVPLFAGIKLYDTAVHPADSIGSSGDYNY